MSEPVTVEVRDELGSPITGAEVTYWDGVGFKVLVAGDRSGRFRDALSISSHNSFRPITMTLGPAQSIVTQDTSSQDGSAALRFLEQGSADCVQLGRRTPEQLIAEVTLNSLFIAQIGFTIAWTETVADIVESLAEFNQYEYYDVADCWPSIPITAKMRTYRAGPRKPDQPTPSPGVLFEEDVSAGIPPGWIVLFPSWSGGQQGSDRFLRGTSSTPGEGAKIGFRLGRTVTRPIRVEARVRFGGPEADEFLAAFILSSGDFENRGYGLNVDTGRSGPRWVHTYRRDPGRNTNLSGSAPVNFRDGQWHVVALELLAGGAIRGFYDGALVFTENDSTYSTFDNILLGTSSLVSYDWDYVRITQQ